MTFERIFLKDQSVQDSMKKSRAKWAQKLFHFLHAFQFHSWNGNVLSRNSKLSPFPSLFGGWWYSKPFCSQGPDSGEQCGVKWYPWIMAILPVCKKCLLSRMVAFKHSKDKAAPDFLILELFSLALKPSCWEDLKITQTLQSNTTGWF